MLSAYYACVSCVQIGRLDRAVFGNLVSVDGFLFLALFSLDCRF